MYSTNTKPYKPYSGRNYKPNQRYSETGYQREYEGYKPQNKKYSIQIKFRRSEEKMKFICKDYIHNENSRDWKFKGTDIPDSYILCVNGCEIEYVMIDIYKE